LEVKATGDIFFPGKWCGALLGGHRSTEALQALDSFLEDNPDYPQLLKNKILVAAYGLQRFNREKSLN
jgi:aminopeptidase N